MTGFVGDGVPTGLHLPLFLLRIFNSPRSEHNHVSNLVRQNVHPTAPIGIVERFGPLHAIQSTAAGWH